MDVVHAPRLQPFKQPVASIIATRRNTWRRFSTPWKHPTSARTWSSQRPLLCCGRLWRGTKPRWRQDRPAAHLDDGQATSLPSSSSISHWHGGYQEHPRAATSSSTPSASMQQYQHHATLSVVLRSRRAAPDMAIVHGRPDLAALHEIRPRLAQRPDPHPPPRWSLARRRQHRVRTGSRSLPGGRQLQSGPRDSAKELVAQPHPVEADRRAEVGVLVFATVMMLHANAEHLDSQLRVVKKQQKKYAWLGTKAANILDKERAELKTSAAVMHHCAPRHVLSGPVSSASSASSCPRR